MHCLPVRRNMIVTDDVIESPQSLVIPEAANREISATVVLKRMLGIITLTHLTGKRCIFLFAGQVEKNTKESSLYKDDLGAKC